MKGKVGRKVSMVPVTEGLVCYFLFRVPQRKLSEKCHI